MRRLRAWVRIALILGIVAAVLYPFRHRIWALVCGQARNSRQFYLAQAPGEKAREAHRFEGHQTVASVLEICGAELRRRFEPICRRNGIAWPPKRIYLLAFKDEKSLEVWAANATGPYARIASYPIVNASGTLGPKRRQGDHQVPEGFYRLPVLNPNSSFHLSVRVDYPNHEDIRHRSVARGQMGGDIYLHGGSGSVGCLAMGDEAIEEIFCLVALAKPANRRILISPVDFRRGRSVRPAPEEAWLRDLYQRIAAALRDFPLSGRAALPRGI